MITFSLSAQAVITQIYALSALHAIVNTAPADQPAQAPAVLCPDQKPALLKAVEMAFGRLCARLLPRVTDCSVDSPDADADADTMLTLTLTLHPAASQGAAARQQALRRTMEQILVADTMAAAYLNHRDDLAAAYADMAASSAQRLCDALGDPAPDPSPTQGLSLTPRWY